MSLKVSIITVCYNSVETIEQTIRSVIGQSYDNIEYIIIDGGSTDGTLDIIKKYEDRVAYWISESDNGLYDAMNKGIQLASGDVIGIINSDDWYDLQAIENVVEVFNNENCDLVHGDLIYASKTGRMLYRKQFNAKKSEIYTNGMIYFHPTVFVKRNIYEEYGKFNTKYQIAADYELMIRFTRNGVNFFYLSKVLSHFRTGGISEYKRKWATFRETKDILQVEQERFQLKKMDREVTLIDKYYMKHRMWMIELFLCDRILKRQLKQTSEWILKVNRKQNFIVFGAGILGEECVDYFEYAGQNVLFYVDSSTGKQGERIRGKLIVPFSELEKVKHDSMIIISSDKYASEMKNQLEDIGLQDEKDFLCFCEIKKKYIKGYCEKIRTWMGLSCTDERLKFPEIENEFIQQLILPDCWSEKSTKMK